MEIITHTQPVQSSTIKESVPIIRASGEYQELKLKSKNTILSVSEQALVSAIDKANRAAQGTEHLFQLKVHESTHQVIVQILDKNKEVIHEIPSEKFIDLVEKLKELSVGAIIDEKR
ncbi:flagellar protein FlaG [Paenibacillus rhizolycopersici]|uniref:flagellar protein FlaG n=1 Tax=Paenibacillus rhizolycopersici TaxID=2780073 RepID=UPI003D2922BC